MVDFIDVKCYLNKVPGRRRSAGETETAFPAPENRGFRARTGDFRKTEG